MKPTLHRILTAFLASAFAGAAFGADHRDGPLTTGDPGADVNDVYAFVNPNNPAETIFAATIFPVATLNSRFSDVVDYRFHFENGATTGGSFVISCRASSGGTIVSCTGPGGLAASGNINRTNVGTGMRLWAGVRDDPFFFDLDAFNLTRTTLVPSFTNPGVNFFRGLNTLVIILGIENARVSNNGANPVVKVYASTNRLGAIGITSGMSGAWYDPANPGHGLHVDILAPATAGGAPRFAAAWFVYNRQGAQRWIIGDGTINGTTATITNAVFTNGGLFPPAFNPAQVSSRPFGTLRFDFTSCNAGTLTFTSLDPEFNSGSLPLARLTSIEGLPCSFLSSGQIDRMGRPGINTVLIDVIASTGKKDQYNRAIDPALWPAMFQTEMQNNLVALDTLDGTTGNFLLPPATAAAVFVDDFLRIDVSKPTCDRYLAVELGVTTECGGRTLRRDVIDDSLAAIVGPGVSDNVANDTTFLADFPFLAAPN